MSAVVGQIYPASNAKRTVCLVAGATANVAAPSGAPVLNPAVLNYPDSVRSVYQSDSGASYGANSAQQSTLMIDVTGTTPTAVFTLWGYLTASAQWYPIVTTSAITANSAQVIPQVGHYDYLQMQIASIGGTSPVYNAWLTTARAVMY